MGSARQKQKDLSTLRSSASGLWDEQRAVLEHANTVVRAAGQQLADFARDEVSPRVQSAFDEKVAPAVASGLAATRNAAAATKEKVAEDILPAVSSAIGSAIAALDASDDPRVREVVKKAGKARARLTKAGGKAVTAGAKAGRTALAASTKAGVKAGVVKKPAPGPGRYILIGLGVVAAAGIAYAVWQTLRADDDLWIEDEPEPLDDEFDDEVATQD